MEADLELLSSDRRSILTDSLVTWLEGVGTNVRFIAPGVIRLERKPRPQVDFELEFAMAPFSEQPLASNRNSAVERRIPILRAGHGLVDAVAHHLSRSDRGVAFALFRPVQGQWPPVVVLRTDYLVSSTTTDSFSEVADALGLGTWLQQLVRELAPPIIETIVMTRDGKEVTHAAFTRAYDKQRGDQNLSSRPEVFDRLTAHIDWAATCAAAMESSREIFNRRLSTTERSRQGATALRERIEHRLNRQRSRESAGLSSSGLELRQLLEAVPDDLEMEVAVLGCGALFVGDPRKLG
jgi:ATP-dependent helicase HepA